MDFVFEDYFWLRVYDSASGICLDVRESTSYAGMQPSDGKRNGCKGSRKESERDVKGFYTRREHVRML